METKKAYKYANGISNYAKQLCEQSAATLKKRDYVVMNDGRAFYAQFNTSLKYDKEKRYLELCTSLKGVETNWVVNLNNGTAYLEGK